MPGLGGNNGETWWKLTHFHIRQSKLAESLCSNPPTQSEHQTEGFPQHINFCIWPIYQNCTHSRRWQLPFQNDELLYRRRTTQKPIPAKTVVEFINTHNESMLPTVPIMLNPGEWGTEVEINAFATLLCTPVYVYGRSGRDNASNNTSHTSGCNMRHSKCWQQFESATSLWELLYQKCGSPFCASDF